MMPDSVFSAYQRRQKLIKSGLLLTGTCAVFVGPPHRNSHEIFNSSSGNCGSARIERVREKRDHDPSSASRTSTRARTSARGSSRSRSAWPCRRTRRRRSQRRTWQSWRKQHRSCCSACRTREKIIAGSRGGLVFEAAARPRASAGDSSPAILLPPLCGGRRGIVACRLLSF